MAELKTKKSDKSVEVFLNKVEKEQKRKDSFIILEIMKEISGDNGKMWGDSIIGFGDYHYKYKSGREGDWFKIGFSPRKQNISLYTMGYLDEKNEYLENIGKYKTGKSCLYINKLADVDIEILKEFLKQSFENCTS